MVTISNLIIFFTLCVYIVSAVIRRMMIMMMVMDSIAPYYF